MVVSMIQIWPQSVYLVANLGDLQIVALEPRLHRHAGELRWNRFEHTEDAGNRHQLGMKLLAEDPRIRVAMRARHHATAQRPIDVYATIRHHLRPGSHHSRDDQVPIARIHALT